MASAIFSAKYPFRCAACGHSHPAGTDALYDDGNNLMSSECHDDLATGVLESTYTPEVSSKTPDTMPRGKTAQDRCQRCFQVPASNGECWC